MTNPSAWPEDLDRRAAAEMRAAERVRLALVERDVVPRIPFKSTNAGLEARLSAVMGEEERRRVKRATREATPADPSAGRRVWMAAVAEERARCLALCAQWPDNLMAKELARRIAQGGM